MGKAERARTLLHRLPAIEFNLPQLRFVARVQGGQ